MLAIELRRDLVGHRPKLGLTRDRRRRLDARAQHAAFLVVAADPAVRKREIRLLRKAVALQHERKILTPGGLAVLECFAQQRTDRVPDLGPAVARELSERGRMARAENGHERVVVDLHEIAAPEHQHRKPRLERDADDEAQARRPFGAPPHGSTRPIETFDAARHRGVSVCHLACPSAEAWHSLGAPPKDTQHSNGPQGRVPRARSRRTP